MSAVDATMDEIRRLARLRHAERYAPDGTPLTRYAASSWEASLVVWARKHPAHPASAGIVRGAEERAKSRAGTTS